MPPQILNVTCNTCTAPFYAIETTAAGQTQVHVQGENLVLDPSTDDGKTVEATCVRCGGVQRIVKAHVGIT